MSATLEQAVNAALATVIDPELRRPITELGMVESVEISDDGRVRLAVLLTIAGCPLRGHHYGRLGKGAAPPFRA